MKQFRINNLVNSSTRQLVTLSTLFVLLVTSCQKAPIRTDVEGFWRLERYTVLSTDETVECNRLYYSITCMVTEMSDRGNSGFDSYIARTGYENNENTLVLRDFKVRESTSDNGDNAPVEGLRNYGINSQEETKFRIVGCDGKTMVLESDYAHLELRKF